MTQELAPTSLGLGTVIYQVPDIAHAKAWYAQAFAQPPYFDQPFYVGFSIGVADPFGNVIGLIENPHFTTEGSR